jgi:nicotinamidase-related amidase
MKISLIIIDIQNAYLQPETKSGASLMEAVEYINEVIPYFRKKNLPIIGVQHINEENNIVPGTNGFEIPEIVKLLPSDPRVHKTYSNAFTKTNLLEILKKNDIDTVLLSGFVSEQCVLSTFRGAKDVDLFPMILKGGTASDKQQNIAFVEDISDTVTYRIIRKLLE